MTITSPARRDFLLSGSALTIAAAALGSGLAGGGKAQAESLPTAPANAIKALFFDVFGTLVDWRTGVARDAELVLKPLGYSIDWIAFADAWRDQYQPAMEEVRSGRMPYVKLDVLHRRMLQQIVPRFGLEKLEDAALDRLTLAWHHLPAWQDAPAGLARLRQRFLIAPVSNGNTALMCDLARRNDFRWDAILGADMAKDFKPKAAVYLTAVDAFNLEPRQCMMCAAHSNDLRAAAELGIRTAFIARPEERPGAGEDAPRVPVDVVARTTEDLATKLGA
ncbi:MAG: haloacid dehalogenase type II [Gammaproteobacteria bacterium]|nr:MAG: haloacid dehalogenase type II [Gammaproteobacteria bacterium]